MRIVQKLCECGCGEAITIKYHHQWKGIPDFIRGHSSRVNNPMTGKHPTEETRKKLSAVHKGKLFTEEHKRKISESQKGKTHTPQNAFKKGNTIGIGRIVSEETRQKMREASTGRTINSGKRVVTKKEKKKRGPTSLETKMKLSAYQKGRIHSEEWRRKLSETKKAQWKDPDFCKKMGKVWGVKPNKPETILINLLESLYPGQWRYTGDVSFTINGKCPDFVNVNGQKKIIELFGDYWHRGDNPADRSAVFSPFGFETLVIWERDLKHIGGVVEKIKKFHEATQ